MRIFFAGGGTGGPTAAVLAVASAVKKLKPAADLYFVGTDKKFEDKLLDTSVIAFTNHLTIPAGKWRRYFSLKNITDLFKFLAAFVKSIYLIGKHRPDLVFGAGSYVQVPLMWAAFFMKVPVVAHQQDWRVILSTKLVTPVAAAITTTIEGSQKEFAMTSGLFRVRKRSKLHWTGNPVRRQILEGDPEKARALFKLTDKLPTVLVLGGGTGSLKINEILRQALPELVGYVQVIHVYGSGKAIKFSHANYHPHELLAGDMAHAYAVSDMVISRAGMSTITELSALGKTAVLIPLPNTPQDDNARLLAFLGAAVAVNEDSLTPGVLVRLVRKILWDAELQSSTKKNIAAINPKNADQKIARLLINIAKNRDDQN